MNIHRQTERNALRATGLAATLFLLWASPALATTQTNLFGGDNPLQVFVNFMVGPFAYAVCILGIICCGAALVFGGDFSGWSRRFLLVAVAGGVVALAGDVVSALFGGGTGFSVPPDMALHAWPWPEATEAVR